MCPLVLGEVFERFVNTLTADGKYPDQDCQKLQLPIQMQLSEKSKKNSHFFSHFSNLDQILNILKEQVIVIANVFRKLETVKSFVRTLFKGSHYRRRFYS